MIRTRDEIIESVNGILPDATDETAIALLEDITDTLSDLEQRAANNFEARYNDLLARYRARFTDPTPEPEPEPEPDPVPDSMTYEDLFD